MIDQPAGPTLLGFDVVIVGTVLAGVAAFAVVLAIYAALTIKDPMAKRVKSLEARRDELKAGIVTASSKKRASLVRKSDTTDMVKERLDILQLDSGRDYRRRRLQDISVYHAPLGSRSAAALDAAFARLTEGAEPCSGELTVKGRSLPVPLTARGVARFAFADLCERPLAAGDYLEVARMFHTVVLSDVPKLTPEKRDEARRFMLLIDALYEHKVKLILSADAPPERLYPAGDTAFEFERTVSRLQEMRSKDYIELAQVT